METIYKNDISKWTTDDQRWLDQWIDDKAAEWPYHSYIDTLKDRRVYTSSSHKDSNTIGEEYNRYISGAFCPSGKYVKVNLSKIQLYGQKPYLTVYVFLPQREHDPVC